MEYLNQRDKKWSNIKLGFGSTTIGSHGCFVTCLSMLAGITPDVANDILKQAGAFSRDLIISDKAAKALDLEYNPPARSETFPVSHICIAEVDMSPAPGKQQHFVVYDPFKNDIIDPWTGQREARTKYKIITFRLFKPKKMTTTLNPNWEKAVSSTSPLLNFDYGTDLNDKETKEFIKKVETLIEKNEALDNANYDLAMEVSSRQKDIVQLGKQIKELREMNEVRQETIDDFESELDEEVILNKTFGGYRLIIKKM